MSEFDFTSVDVENLSRNFGRRRALYKVSFTCRAGQIVGLLGPNGAGKSTLLAILATLAAASSGTVRYGAATAADSGSAIRARLGALGHDLYLYPELTARENLLFFARLQGIRKIPDTVDAALARAGLQHRADEPVSGFSRGMRQRLAVERALIHGPRLVLLDEPFTGLDDESVDRLTERLQGLRLAGAIVLLTTHDLDVVEGLLDVALVLVDGRLAACDRAVPGLRNHYRGIVSAGSRS